MLAQRPNLAAALLPLLREDVRERQACTPSITVASADCARATAALTGAADAQRHGADGRTDATTQPLHGEGRTIRCRCRCRLHRMMRTSTVKRGAQRCRNHAPDRRRRRARDDRGPLRAIHSWITGCGNAPFSCIRLAPTRLS